ncbi:hypothetical protein [Cellulomonas hominis]
MLHGPAVIVDDDVDSGVDPAVDSFVRDTNARQIPLLKYDDLPDSRAIPHWRSTSVIILDWELHPGGSAGYGVSLPDSVRKRSQQDVVSFVHQLLDETYCPVFIFSNESPELIWSVIDTQLPSDPDRLRNRIHVHSKSSVENRLFEEISQWTAKHPAVYAWKAWELEYEAASSSVFRDFEASSLNWPAVLWQSAQDDSTNPHNELTEVLSRNVLHRFRPVVFDEQIISDGGVMPARDSLRRVLHRQAVIGRDGLHSDVISPGDFFFRRPRRGELPPSVWINITPACDLVPRRKRQKLDDIRLTLLRADRMAEADYKFKDEDKAEQFLRRDEPSSQILHLLFEEGVPYKAQFRDWETSQWSDVKGYRRGRLLEPYVTQLQQKNALYMHRQGLPRVPTAFHEFTKPRKR